MVFGSNEHPLKPSVLDARIAIWLAQADSLARLGREADRERKLRVAIAIAMDCCKANPSSALAYLNVARVARAAGRFDFAKDALATARRLDGTMTGTWSSTAREIGYEENQLRREHEVASGQLHAMAQLIVYVCQKCGRLLEYISVPCMYCGWHPTTLLEISHSGRLCTGLFKLWDLLGIGRAISVGRKPTEVVANLAEVAADLMSDPNSSYREAIEGVLKTVLQNQTDKDLFFAYHDAPRCRNCNKNVGPLHDAKHCPHCRVVLRIPPPLRLLECLTRLLIHFQHNFGGPHSTEFDLFIRYLVSLQSKLFRVQETPSNRERAGVLDMMKKLARFEIVDDLGEIIIADTQNIVYRLSHKIPEGNRSHVESVAIDFTNMLQFVANWMTRNKALC